ncbi:MAG: phosphoribosylglycinamide formyltransferase [Acidobacteriota bacterium]|nr:phosphoribosylglycinamide formyltransferase [Acidobacteriota bacterium]
MKKVGILISGRGSNMVALLEGMRAGEIPAQAALVVADRADAPGLAKAASFGVPTAVVDRKDYRGRREEHDRAVADALEAAGVDLVCLAGYMRILGAAFVERFAGRMINIHPALLPAFPGLHAQRQALEQGARISGCTVHFVDAQVDHGPTIVQAAVPVLPDDTEQSLSTRILEQEHRVYPLALKWLCQGRVRVEQGRAVLEGEAVEPPGSLMVPGPDA